MRGDQEPRSTMKKNHLTASDRDSASGDTRLADRLCLHGRGPQDKGYRRKILTKPEMQSVARQKQAATAIPHVSEGINEGRKKTGKFYKCQHGVLWETAPGYPPA